MDVRNQILTAHQQFNDYLESIDLEALQSTYTRHEWEDFRKELYALKTRSLAYDIGKMTEQMKQEEYPELTGVHHFPAVRSIDFLTEEKKIELDEFLVQHRVGNYVPSLWRFTNQEHIAEQLEAWLIKQGIIEEVQALMCYHCGNNGMTPYMNTEEKEAFEAEIRNFLDTHDYDDMVNIMKKLPDYCDECDSHIEVTEIKTNHWKKALRMKAERDTSLDHV